MGGGFVVCWGFFVFVFFKFEHYSDALHLNLRDFVPFNVQIF